MVRLFPATEALTPSWTNSGWRLVNLVWHRNYECEWECVEEPLEESTSREAWIKARFESYEDAKEAILALRLAEWLTGFCR